jgi:hypothetical protein
LSVHCLKVLKDFRALEELDSRVRVDQKWHLELDACPLNEPIAVGRATGSGHHHVLEAETAELLAHRPNERRHLISPKL